MNWGETTRKARLAVGVEAARDRGEMALALAGLSFLGMVSWAVADFTMRMAREGLMFLLLVVLPRFLSSSSL